jgi:hypothetical protein
VFASLNSKGLPLTPLDIMKNDYISKGGEVDKWNTLKSRFTKDDDSPDETRLIQFVLNNYDAFENMETGKSLTKGSIVRAYQELFKNKGKTYIDSLITNAGVFLKIANSEDSYNFGLSGLAKLDSTTAYPLLMYLQKNCDRLEIQDYFDEIIKLFVKLYVRRNIALTPKASNLRHELIRLKNSIQQEEIKSKKLFDFLTQEVKKISPKDDVVRIALKDGLYDKNKRTTRFVLISLERKYGGKIFNKGTPDSLDDFFEKTGQLRWSIEHILPQGELPPHWRKEISPADLSKADDIQEECVHLLGNLTLTPYNPELGSKPFVEKVHFKDDNGNEVGLSLGLFLNQSIDKTKMAWTVEEIGKRNEVLAEKVLELFAIS